jgi:hypothetical protein
VISKIWQIFHPKKEDNVIKFAPQKEIPFLSKKNQQNLSKTIAGIPERSIRKPMVKRSFAGLIYQYYTFSKVAPTKSSTAPRAHTLRIIR